MIILGSGIEIERGAWLFWAETILMLTLIFASLWCIWRFVYSTDRTDAMIKNTITVSSITDIKSFFSIIFLYSISATLYLAIFGIYMSN